MCGRFTLTKTSREIAEAFSVSEPPNWQPKYNIAPTDWVLALVKAESDRSWQLRYLRWGLIPPWAKDNKIASKLINARAETLTEKPSFRQALRSRRCLILADGFYEWREEESGHRHPYYFHLQDRPIFTFAGLWETWQPKQGEVISSCTIITTSANAQMQPYHHRMPVLLGEEVYYDWLDPTKTKPDEILPLLQVETKVRMDCYPVGLRVNSPAHDDPDCIEPLPSELEETAIAFLP